MRLCRLLRQNRTSFTGSNHRYYFKVVDGKEIEFKYIIRGRKVVVVVVVFFNLPK